MALNRFSRGPAVLIAASLVATSSAIDFGAEGDISQTAGTVAPGGEASITFGSEWAQTTSSSNNGPMMAPSGSGLQGWSRPTSADPPSVWTPTRGQGSGNEDQGWIPTSGESSGFDQQEMSLECSESDEEKSPGLAAGSSSSTPTMTAAPAASSGDGFQQASSLASLPSSPNIPTSTSSGDSGPTASSPSLKSARSTPSSGVGAEEDTLKSTSTTASTSETGQQEEANTAQISTNSSSGQHATFGTITSGSNKCVVGNPNTYISTKDLEWVWENRIKTEVMGYDNWILDHLVANKGSINYCVRWDSNTTTLTKSVASKLEGMLTRQHAAWNHWLIGYDCWPFNKIKVNVVGFAARDASNLEWSDDSLGKIYIGDLGKDGAPQCPTKCYRSYNTGDTDGWSESSGCETEPFDISLWPTQGLGGGWGTYWGQQVDLDDMLKHLDDKELEIVSHEMGHGFGLPDFYQEPKPDNFPPTLMDAMTSSTVRDTDGWMLRRVLEHKKSNYNF